MFQDWKEKYPPSEYAYDPDMSLSEWEEEYLTEIDLGLFSTPSQYGYYHPVETYRNPAKTMKEPIENRGDEKTLDITSAKFWVKSEI